MTTITFEEPGLYEGWRSVLDILKPELDAHGLAVEPDLDGDHCCVGYNLSRPGADGVIRLFLSSRGCAGKYTPLSLGWNGEVDIERAHRYDQIGAEDTLLSIEEILQFFRGHLTTALQRL